MNGASAAGPGRPRVPAGQGRLRGPLAAPASGRAAFGLAAAMSVAATLGCGVALAEGSALSPPAPALPSGQSVEPLAMALERQQDGQLWLILRYHAPRIAREGGDLAYADVVADLDALCAGPGLAVARAAAAAGTPADQIVVTLMDRPVPRGERDPSATQFLSAYRPGPEGCAWE